MDPHRLRVLLVEDHQPTRYALRRLLDRRGWDVAEAATLAEGVALLGVDAPPDCVVLDLQLPDGPGEALLRKIRSERLPTRVVVSSGVRDAARLSELEFMRPDAVMAKPTDPGRLCEACEAPATV